MAEIVKVYKEHLPQLRLIGKCYGAADKVDGSYGAKWGEWFEKGWFAVLEGLGEAKGIENGYLGFMRCDDTVENFQYWIGMFFAPGTRVPDGFDCIDLEAGDVGVCWIQGKEGDGSIYGMHDICEEKLKQQGMCSFKLDKSNRLLHFERYNCPRFTTPDKDGTLILDYGIYLAE